MTHDVLPPFIKAAVALLQSLNLDFMQARIFFARIFLATHVFNDTYKR